jgi:hypothetical protein
MPHAHLQAKILCTSQFLRRKATGYLSIRTDLRSGNGEAEGTIEIRDAPKVLVALAPHFCKRQREEFFMSKSAES